VFLVILGKMHVNMTIRGFLLTCRCTLVILEVDCKILMIQHECYMFLIVICF